MRTAICDELGIEFPVFAFSHCRDVVAAVTNAGGFGVLGALAFEAERLEVELDWIDQHVGGRPYGVDFAMPNEISHDRRPRAAEGNGEVAVSTGATLTPIASSLLPAVMNAVADAVGPGAAEQKDGVVARAHAASVDRAGHLFRHGARLADVLETGRDPPRYRTMSFGILAQPVWAGVLVLTGRLRRWCPTQ